MGQELKISKDELRVSVKSLIERCEFTDARKTLNKFARLTPHSEADIILISQFRLWLGNSKAALRILGPLLTLEELAVVRRSSLFLQARFAYMLGFVGAFNLALRHYENIEKVMKSRRMDIATEFPKFFQFRAYTYLASHHYWQAAQNFRRSIELHGKNTETYLFAHIGLSDSLARLGKTNEAIELVKKILAEVPAEQRIFQAICYHAMGEYLFFEERLPEAKEAFDHSALLFGPDIKTKDWAFLLISVGAFWVTKRNFKLGEKYLCDARTILKETSDEPESLRTTYYWLEQVKGYKLNLEARIALRCRNGFSQYSVLSGANVALPSPLTSWFSKRHKRTSNDCWIITPSSLQPARYIGLGQSIFSVGTTDLCALLSFRRYGFEFHSQIQGRCLAAIIGAGDIGISLWELMSFVYEMEFFTLEQGELRIKNLINRLGRLFAIYQKGGRLFCRIEKGNKIILPMNLVPQGHHQYFARNYQTDFRRHCLEKHFGINARMANRWIQQWLSDGIIEAQGRGATTFYFWKVSV